MGGFLPATGKAVSGNSRDDAQTISDEANAYVAELFLPSEKSGMVLGGFQAVESCYPNLLIMLLDIINN
jgi:hypothetical protein